MSLSIIEIITVLAISLIPSLVMVFLILYSDRKSSEPFLLILICIFSGIFTICLSLLISNIILPNISILSNIISKFDLFKIVLLAIIEEYSKLLVLYLFISRNKNYDDIYDGFVYSSLIALSFAVFETLMYVFNEPDLYQMESLALLRDFTTIPLHLVCGIIMGYFVSLEKFSKSKKYKFIKLLEAMIIPVIVHASYNSFFTFTLNALKNSNKFVILLIIFLLSIYVLGILFIKKIKEVNSMFINKKEYPKEYNYLMTKDEYDTIVKEVYYE